MDSKKKGAPQMSDEERAKLVQKLDDDMAKHLADLEQKAKNTPGYSDGWNEDTWEDEMAKHPFFASNERYFLNRFCSISIKSTYKT